MDSSSNAHVGKEFEVLVRDFFLQNGIVLEENYALNLGLYEHKKSHRFDLGNKNKAIIVECKSHKWTSGDKVPSAKLTLWNEAMYYFLLSPANYRKIFAVLRDVSPKRRITLAQYYIKTYKHLIPKDIEIWEFDITEQKAEKINV